MVSVAKWIRPTSPLDRYTDPPSSARKGMKSLLWVAAGAVWALVALKAWSNTQKVDARRRTFSVSDRLLGQVFPNDVRR